MYNLKSINDYIAIVKDFNTPKDLQFVEDFPITKSAQSKRTALSLLCLAHTIIGRAIHNLLTRAPKTNPRTPATAYTNKGRNRG